MLAISNFFKDFLTEEKNLNVCKLCSSVVNVEKISVSDNEYDDFNYKPIKLKLRELKEYQKYLHLINYLDKILDRISIVLNININYEEFSGKNNLSSKDYLIKEIINLIVAFSNIFVSYDTDKKYSLLKSLYNKFNIKEKLNIFLPLEINNILSYINVSKTSKHEEGDITNTIFNNILLFVIGFLINNLNLESLIVLPTDKIVNLDNYINYKDKLFNGLKFKRCIGPCEELYNANDLMSLNYLIYNISYNLIKYNVWKRNNTSNKYDYISHLTIINSIYTFLNATVEIQNNVNNTVLRVFTNNFYTKINYEYSKKYILKEIKDSYQKKEPKTIKTNILEKELSLAVPKNYKVVIKPLKKYTTKFGYGQKYYNINKLNPYKNHCYDLKCLFEDNNKDKKNKYKIWISTIDNNKRSWDAFDNSIIQNYENITNIDKLVRYSVILRYFNNKNILNKLNHNYKIDKISAPYDQNIISKLNETLLKTQKKICDHNDIIFNKNNIGQKDHKEKDFFIKKLLEKKDNTCDFIDKLIALMSKKMSSEYNFGSKIYQQYLDKTVYIIDHNFMGLINQDPVKNIIFTDNDTKYKILIYYEKELKQNVIKIYIPNDKINLYYSYNTHKYIAYQKTDSSINKLPESNRVYLKVNFSTKIKLLLLGVEKKGINQNKHYLNRHDNIISIITTIFTILIQIKNSFEIETQDEKNKMSNEQYYDKMFINELTQLNIINKYIEKIKDMDINIDYLHNYSILKNYQSDKHKNISHKLSSTQQDFCNLLKTDIFSNINIQYIVILIINYIEQNNNHENCILINDIISYTFNKYWNIFSLNYANKFANFWELESSEYIVDNTSTIIKKKKEEEMVEIVISEEDYDRIQEEDPYGVDGIDKDGNNYAEENEDDYGPSNN